MLLLWGELKFPNEFSFVEDTCWLIITAHFHFIFIGMSILQVIKSMADPFTLKEIVRGKKRKEKCRNAGSESFYLFFCLFISQDSTLQLLLLWICLIFLLFRVQRWGSWDWKHSKTSTDHIIVCSFKMCMLFKNIYSLCWQFIRSTMQWEIGKHLSNQKTFLLLLLVLLVLCLVLWPGLGNSLRMCVFGKSVKEERRRLSGPAQLVCSKVKERTCGRFV